MNCPYCGKEMQQGAIITGNSIDWYPGNADWLLDRKNRVRLSRPEMWDRPRAESFYCADCRMVVVPVPEIEEPLEAVKNKLKGLKERAQQQKDTITADIAAQKEAKEKDKRRKKDPWEV